MNIYLCIAGVLSLLLGLVHSFLGEYLIFRTKRISGRIVPTKSSPDLQVKHLRIMWASWHLVSLFGWCLGALLLKFGLDKNVANTELTNFIIPLLAYTMLLASGLVVVGTKARHPGWIVLMIIGILIFLSSKKN